MTDKSDKLMKTAKDTIKLSMVSMVGMGALGAMGNVSGMPAQSSNVAGIAGAGLALANVGQLAKTGMVVADTVTGQTTQSKVKKPKNKLQQKEDVVSKILYG